METINKRNTETFEKAFKELTNKTFKQQEEINLLNQNYVILFNRMNELDQKITIQKVQLTGLGPSVRT